MYVKLFMFMWRTFWWLVKQSLQLVATYKVRDFHTTVLLRASHVFGSKTAEYDATKLKETILENVEKSKTIRNHHTSSSWTCKNKPSTITRLPPPLLRTRITTIKKKLLLLWSRYVHSNAFSFKTIAKEYWSSTVLHCLSLSLSFSRCIDPSRSRLNWIALFHWLLCRSGNCKERKLQIDLFVEQGLFRKHEATRSQILRRS